MGVAQKLRPERHASGASKFDDHFLGRESWTCRESPSQASIPEAHTRGSEDLWRSSCKLEATEAGAYDFTFENEDPRPCAAPTYAVHFCGRSEDYYLGGLHCLARLTANTEAEKI